MTVRNRLNEFHDRAQKPRFISVRNERSVVDENGQFILDFLSKVRQINEKFAFLDEKISEVKRVQSDILEFSQTDAGLHPLYDSVKKTINELVDKIRGMEKKFDPKKFTGSETELRIYNTQLMSMKRRVAGLITRYYSIQEEYKDKCKAQVKRQALIAGADITRINFEEALGFKTEIFMHTVFPDFDMTHHYLHEIKKRHEDFIKLEKTIAELHELFFDLALVIQVDFTLMDRIDKHSTFVDRLVMDGQKDIRGYQNQIRSSKLRRFITIGCVTFVVAVVVLVLLWMFRNYIFGQ